MFASAAGSVHTNTGRLKAIPALRPHAVRVGLQGLAQEKTLRRLLAEIAFNHPLNTPGMRDCQTEGITGLEQSPAQDLPRSLLQMATGAGKTFTACAFTYRLIKFAKAKRVLFLVDRANLGRQAKTDAELPVLVRDALAGKNGEYDLVVANPPFGKKSSVTIVNEAGESSRESLVINRDDFWASRSNKQLI